MRHARGLALALALLLPPSRAAAVYPETIWLRGANAWGGQGVHQVDGAMASVPGDLTLSVIANVFATQNLLAQGDHDSGSTTALNVVWTPWMGTQVGLSGSFEVNSYSTFASLTVQSLGNPELHLKYGYEFFGNVAIGAVVHAMLPTFRSGSGIGNTAFVGRGRLLGSYHPLPFLEVSANAGFVLDRSDAPFTTPPAAAQRFALGINNSNHFDYGVAVLGRIRPAYLAPFLEFSGTAGGSTLGTPATAVITPGVRLDSSYGGVFEVAIGADFRVAGAPTATGTFAGVPPWRVFAQLTMHVLTTPEARLAWERTDCTVPIECPKGYVCTNGVECTQLFEPPKETLLLTPVEKPTVVVRGRVRDMITGAPVPRAKILVEGFPQAPLQADVGGTFVSFPLEATGKPLDFSATAPGYVSVHQTVTIDAGASGNPLVLSMHQVEHVPGGHILGAVRDRRTSKPVPNAKLFIPSLKKDISVSPDGEFKELLPVGTFEVVISAPKYRSQRLRTEISDGETVILNVDLFPGR